MSKSIRLLPADLPRPSFASVLLWVPRLVLVSARLWARTSAMLMVVVMWSVLVSARLRAQTSAMLMVAVMWLVLVLVHLWAQMSAMPMVVVMLKSAPDSGNIYKTARWCPHFQGLLGAHKYHQPKWIHTLALSCTLLGNPANQ